MPKEVVAAIIAVGGVLVSAVVAFIVGRSQARAELEKAQLETRTMFLAKLYDARLSAYPGLYELLGILGGRVLEGTATLGDVEETWEKIKIWDQRNALLLSPLGVQTAIELRRTFLRLLKLSPEQLSRKKQRKELLPALIELQMCLKTELGILNAESFHSPARIDTLREATLRAVDADSDVAG